jgi:divalent metal cation (Fe/Co/Zn/Cd) transporter
MHARHVDAMPPEGFRTGLSLSLLSVAWTVSASVIAEVLGFRAGSLVLIAFGFTGFFDAAGSTALAVHFRHALRTGDFSERRERTALRIITLGMVTVGVVTAIESVRRLLGGESTKSVPAGLVLAAVSIGVLAVLSRRKRQVGHQILSRALLADGWLSATGCVMAVVTVVGTGATSAFGWWWVDPVAALVVAAAAVGVAVAMHRGESQHP